MENQNEKLVAQLNHLITICNDGKYGYETAAEDAESPTLKAMFLSYCAERAQFSSALRQEIINAGGDPDKGGGPLGAIHRAWIDVKAAISTKEDKAVLGACITGEKAALHAYNEVLEESYSPGTLRELLLEQRYSIEEALNKVEALHESV